MAVRVAIHGAAGRMGQRLVALGSADDDLEIVAAIDNAYCPSAGCDVGELAGVGPIGVPCATAWPEPDDPIAIEAVIDFSVPEATGQLVQQCVERRLPLVYATTGLTADDEQRLVAAAEAIPICKAASMSAAVNLTMKLAQLAAGTLKDAPGGADVEIIERHHRHKEDAPSGTALAFGRVIAREMGLSGETHGRHGRSGARPHDEIGYHAVRCGDNPGQHAIVFGMPGETIELRVAATNRDCYATGALAAAKWLQGKPPGIYDMQDVLGLR